MAFKVLVYSTRSYERPLLEAEAHSLGISIEFLDTPLGELSAPLAKGFDAVSIFVNDRVTRSVLAILSSSGVKALALRCAGFNQIDLQALKESKIRAARVPAYSPHAVAEHTLALLLSLNRHIPKAYNRVREGNFSLDGLVGFDLYGKTVGVVGTGKIGSIVSKIFKGFGCRVLAYDLFPQKNLDVEYVDKQTLFKESDIITLHCPLNEETHHLIDGESIQSMKDGVFLVNTGRGALVDATALIAGLKSKKIGGLALDVYEEEENLFFSDRSGDIIMDDTFVRLMTFPNVLITGHQAFLTHEALSEISSVTLENIDALLRDQKCPNEIL